MPEAYKTPCEEYDRMVRRVEAVEKENAELRARVAELETGPKLDITTFSLGADAVTSVGPWHNPNIAAQIEAGSPGPDWHK